MKHVMGNGLPTKRFLFHPLFHGYFRQRSTIVAAMASNPPFFDPFFLNVRLPALRAHKHALHVMYFPNFFHAVLLAGAAPGSHRYYWDCKADNTPFALPDNDSRPSLDSIPDDR
jgi:hypothetical protein